eukprot:TRINITY_DN11977_c0_g1_i1.p2 TRINITY_DN11977_c0_g1~~TRINITY_DN11977_c0_g1_i1.p2  ORF type:complete len:187 (+),score=53.79 TRINITY_DN11977_c0_g1_i1:54-614(+)
MPKKLKDARNEWDIGICEAPCHEPLTCLVGMVCCPCYIWLQRMEIYEGRANKEYKCCGGAYCFDNDMFCGRSMPGLCLACEVCLCPWCALYGNRYLIQKKYSIKNSCFDACLIQLACLCSWLGCLVTILSYCGLVPKQWSKAIRKIIYIMDVIYLMFAGCLLAQQQHEMEKHGPGSPPTSIEMDQM